MSVSSFTQFFQHPPRTKDNSPKPVGGTPKIAFGEEGAAATYLTRGASYSSVRSSVNREDHVKEAFAMQCIHIDDLMAMDRLPRHDELVASGKIIVPKHDDKRKIVFVSSKNIFLVFDVPK